MGKEAKIGVAVIMILLITFGVVLARRLSSSSPTPTATASTNQDNDDLQRKEVPAAADTPLQIASAGSSRPTVVEPEQARGKTPTPSPGVSGQWNGISAGGQATQETGTSAAKPSYMPTPPEPPWHQSVSEQSDLADAAQRYDAYRDRTPEPSLDAAPVAPSGNALRVLPAPGQPSQQALGDARTQSGSASYSVGVSSTATMPTYQQTSRYSYPASPPSPAPARSVPVSSGQFNPGLPSEPGLPKDIEGLTNENGEYEIQPNDSFWVISKRLYGTGAYFKALSEHNSDQVADGNRLKIGDVILAPDVSELEDSYPGLCPKPGRGELLRNRVTTVSARSPYTAGRTYEVEEGDTLCDIARWELGKTARWTEIYELNRDLLGNDFDYLVPGTQLVLPNDNHEPADAITSRPDNGAVYQR